MAQLRGLDSHPCEAWPLDRDAGCWDVPDGTPESTITQWNHAATEFLWAATGRRLGPSCPITVRPCRKKCMDGYLDLLRFPGGVANSTGGFIPYIGADGQFRNATLCSCRHSCNCGPEICEVVLPGPIYDLVEVRLDGDVVDEAGIVVVDGTKVRRITLSDDDDSCWPSCQDLTKRDGPGTFSITYRTGLILTSMAQMAVTELTAHFIRGCDGGCGCGADARQNLQRLSRQGVDLEFADPQQVFNDGRTGIEIVDFFIRSMNPYGLGSTLRVLSPDAGTRGRNLPEIWR